MQSSLPAGWLAFTGRELNPLDRYERFQITFSFPSPEFSWRNVRRVFPSTAGRLAYQARPSRRVTQLKPAPGMR